MADVIDCRKCYHLQKTAPDAAYCAHMHVNPCYRGRHREPIVTPAIQEKLPPLPPKNYMSNYEKGCLAARERKAKASLPPDLENTIPSRPKEPEPQVFRAKDIINEKMVSKAPQKTRVSGSRSDKFCKKKTRKHRK